MARPPESGQGPTASLDRVHRSRTQVVAADVSVVIDEQEAVTDRVITGSVG